MKANRTIHQGTARGTLSWNAIYKYVRRHFHKLSFWNKAAFVGTVFGIVTGFAGLTLSIGIPVYSWIQDKRAYAQGARARAAIMVEVANVYSTLFYAAEDVPSLEQPFERSKVHLAYAAHYLELLQRKMAQNNRVLDNQLVSSLSEYTAIGLSVQKQLTYFCEVKNPQMIHYDFASISPVPKLKQLTGLLDQLRAQFPEVLSQGKGVAGNLKSPDELEKEWDTFERKSDRRVVLNPSRYVWRAGKTPCVFNPSNLAQLTVNTNAGAAAYMMFGFE